MRVTPRPGNELNYKKLFLLGGGPSRLIERRRSQNPSLGDGVIE